MMGSRLKEDEKNEKAIRALLRKPFNRRCINCNSLGPQYVCLNFWTFVCTQCSGIHREFTHRVKSVSMSKFSSQEVANLEAGGNESGRATFFKDWDSQRQPLPDSSNVDRLREFIKMVYVEKRFSGERPLPRSRGGDREELYDNRRTDSRPNYRADSRSPPYEDRYDDRGRRSNAGYDDRRADEQGARFDEKRSPARFESERGRYERNQNDTRSYDERPRYETRNRRQHEDRYNEGLDRRSEDRFANEKGSRAYGFSSPPPVRPVKEILGEDVPPLHVENHGSQPNGSRVTDKQQSSQDGRGQRFGSSSSFGSVDSNVQAVSSSVKREDSISLIDLSAEPDPSAPKLQPDPFGMTSVPAADTSNNTGWATFDSAATAPSSGSVAQASAVSSVQGPFGGFTSSLSGLTAQSPAVRSAQGLVGGIANPSTLGAGDSQWAAQWTSGAQPLDPSGNNWSVLAGPSGSTVSSQSWNAFPTNISEASSLQASQGSKPLDSLPLNNTTGAAAQVGQAQPSGRSEIPEDLFTPSVQYMGNQHFASQYLPPMGGMGFMPPGSYMQPQKSRNPFDLPVDSGSNQFSREFPNLSSMNQALPTLSMGQRPPSGPGFVTSGAGYSAHGPHWVQTNTLTPPHTVYPSMSTGGGSFAAQQSQSVLPQSMQGPFGGNTPGTSLRTNLPGVSLGVNLPGSFSDPNSYPNPNFSSNPKQGPASFSPAPTFQPSQNLFGGAESIFSAQGPPGQFPSQNTAGLTSAGSLTSADSFMAGSGSPHRLLSQSSMGSLGNVQGVDPFFTSQPSFPGGPHRLLSQGSMGSLSNVQGADPFFPSQTSMPGQRLVSHSSLGSRSSMTPSDAQYSVQTPQFTSNPMGNPFG